METQKVRTWPAHVLRVWPLLGLAALFTPGLSPAAFLPQIQDWSYFFFVRNSLEVDKVFGKAFSGVRDMFAVNALLIFCAMVLFAAVIVQLVGCALTLARKNKKMHNAGLLLQIFGGAVSVAAGIMLTTQALSGNATAQTKYAAMQMQYLCPPGAMVQAGLGFAGFLLGVWARRQWMRQNLLYLPMTRNERRDNLKGFAFIAPYLIGFACFVAFPLLFSAFSSFTYYNITAMQKWYGVNNFINLFTTDDYFYQSLGNTLYYVVFSVPCVIVVAMCLALLMNMRIKFMGIFRTLYYLPSVLSGVAVCLLWQWIFEPSHGLLNNVLAVFGIKGPAWLFDAQWTKPAMIVMRMWSTGGTMILLLAALQNVPVDLYEAGAVDGAVGWRKFRYITLPMISPTLFFVMVTGISGAFQVYDNAYIMIPDPVGGPGKSLYFYNLYLFLTAFRDQSMGLASAMAWVLFAIIMTFTVIQMQASKRWVHYEGGTDK